MQSYLSFLPKVLWEQTRKDLWWILLIGKDSFFKPDKIFLSSSLYQLILFPLQNTRFSACWPRVVALGEVVLCCHSDTVGGHGLEVHLCVKIPICISHSGQLSCLPRLLLLFNDDLIFGSALHHPPLDIQGPSTYCYRQHLWGFKI